MGSGFPSAPMQLSVLGKGALDSIFTCQLRKVGGSCPSPLFSLLSGDPELSVSPGLSQRLGGPELLHGCPALQEGWRGWCSHPLQLDYAPSSTLTSLQRLWLILLRHLRGSGV